MLALNYSDIQEILSSKRLAGDPALHALNFQIEPIPSLNGCPLGLYFPRDEYLRQFGKVISGGTIILPPDAQEFTLLHEIGHRYGHYYHNDLSEGFANDFARKYLGVGARFLIETCPQQDCTGFCHTCMGALKSGEGDNEVTKERRGGEPRTDPERIAEHYGINIEEACDLLRTHS
ncbi:unnamed protein product, partial [marine sediment metagenome]